MPNSVIAIFFLTIFTYFPQYHYCFRSDPFASAFEAEFFGGGGFD
jgi:hypothetical protein